MRIAYILAKSLVMLPLALVSGRAETLSNLKPELVSLAYFEGAWSCDGHFFNGDRKIAADMIFQADVNGTWLRLRHDDRPPNQFHALELWGFDKKANQFVAVITDSGGGLRLFTSPGWEDNRWVWAGDKLAPGSNTAQHFLFEKKNAREFVMTYEVSRSEGDWKPIDSLTCTRQ